MDFLSAIVYGIIQGFTEFLPVSSSGHLAILPHVMDIKDPGVAFDLMMHIGTALAVMIYFKKEVLRLIKGSLQFIFNKENARQNPDGFTCNFIISTITSVILILIIKDYAKSFGRSTHLIAINLIVFGIILFLSDLKKAKNDCESYMINTIRIKEAILIGISQAFAIFPGVSRSGATISCARFLGLDRRSASSYSFLLSLPIIVAGAAKTMIDANFQLGSGISLSVLGVGLVVSFVIGLLTVHFFLKLVANIPLATFTVYRILMGIVLFIWF
ncbi:MAG: undecaprenyl-diphosphatase [Thermoproteota archaeon]|jgi:undecaprenyl-diphosphatase